MLILTWEGIIFVDISHWSLGIKKNKYRILIDRSVQNTFKMFDCSRFLPRSMYIIFPYLISKCVLFVKLYTIEVYVSY